MSIAGFIRNLKLIAELRHNPPFKKPPEVSIVIDGNDLIQQLKAQGGKAEQTTPIPAAALSSEDRLTGIEKELSSLKQLLEAHGIRLV